MATSNYTSMKENLKKPSYQKYKKKLTKKTKPERKTKKIN